MFKANLSKVFILLLVAVVTSGTVLSDTNWPSWRGPNGNSVSSSKSLPTTWSDKANVAWKTPIAGDGASSPCIWGDSVFITAQDNEKLMALKFDLKTGKNLWSKELSTGEAIRDPLRGKPGDQRRRQKFHKLHNLASPSPVTDGKAVVFLFGNGDLACANFEGTILWKKNLQKDQGVFTIWWGYANSPLIHDNFVICTVMQDSLEDLEGEKAQSFLIAYDLATGKEVWKTPRKTIAKAESCDSYTTPIYHKAANQTQIILMGGNQLDAYDPNTGKQLWKKEGLNGGRTITGPTIEQNTVFATQGMRGPLVAINLDKSSGLPTNEKAAWEYTKNTPDSCCPVGTNGLIFIISDNGFAQCLDANNGTSYWNERIGGDYKSSPLACNGKIYFTNLEGVCTVVEATKTFTVVAKNSIGEGVIASPAVSKDHLLVRTRKSLICIGAPFSK
jgi:outer membrane protein assembly factor BamB